MFCGVALYYLIYRTLFRHGMSINGLMLTDKEALYNGRVKYRRESDGSLTPLEILYCNRLIFNPSGVHVSEYTKAVEWRLDYEQTNAELYGGAFPRSGAYKPERHPDENLERSKRRAVGKMQDYILCNDFDCFVTLTLDGEKISRDDYGAVIKRLNTYLDNRVRRNGLIYLGVPELHKKGGFHFHFLCNSSALKLVGSGTVSVQGHKRPIKVATADLKGIPLEQRHTVYNVSDWTLGFSTAILTYGERLAVARYIGKYIAKGSEKIGGRWYYSGGKLALPVCEYCRGGFDKLGQITYEFDCAGGRFKVIKFDDKGEAITHDRSTDEILQGSDVKP